MKFWALSKKDEFHSLNILENIHSEQSGFFNAPKILFQDDLLRSAC